VMSGFSTKLRDRLHALLSDVVVESVSAYGFAAPQAKMELIRKDPFLGPRVAAMTPTLEFIAMLQFRWPNGDPVVLPVRLIGIYPATRASMGGFQEYLVRQHSNAKPSFELTPEAQRRLDFNNVLMQPPVRAQLGAIQDPAVPPAPAPPATQLHIPPKVPRGAFI